MDPPLKIKISKKKTGDFIFGTFTGFVASAKFKCLYEKENLNGILSFSPVQLYYRSKLIDAEYYYPKIVLSNARVDIDKSGIKFKGNQICNSCQGAGRIILDMKGLFFEDENNIIEDIFNTKVLGQIPVVSEKLRDFVERNGLSNLTLIEAKKYKPVLIFPPL